LIRIRVRTFLDLAAMVPKPKDEEEKEKAGGKGLASALGAEIRARKEKADREKLLKESGQGSAAQLAAAAQALLDAESKSKSGGGSGSDEKKKAEEHAALGSPPSVCTVTLSPSASIRELLQCVLDFYAPWGIELDPDSIRLVSNGAEFSKADRPRASPVGQGVLAPPSATAASASSSLAKLAPSVFQSKVGESLSLFPDGSEEKQQLLLM
jgi:hypothetical protein